MVDAVGTSVYTYGAAGQLLTEDGPFSSDTVIHAVRNLRMQHRGFRIQLKSQAVSSNNSLSHGADTPPRPRVAVSPNPSRKRRSSALAGPRRPHLTLAKPELTPPRHGQLPIF